MARIRTVKPEMAHHEELFDIEQATGQAARFFWAMLPTHCDREGRFHWRPRAIKAALLPYDDGDIHALLDALVGAGMLERYEVDGKEYGCIPTWHKHQRVNAREAQSTVPVSWTTKTETVDHENRNRDARSETCVDHGGKQPCSTVVVGKGKEGKGKERKGRSEETHTAREKTEAESGRTGRQEGQQDARKGTAKGLTTIGTTIGSMLGDDAPHKGFSDLVIGAYCEGMGYDPDSHRSSFGKFPIIDKLSRLSANNPDEVREVAGYYRAEAATFSAGMTPSLERFVARYEDLRAAGRNPVKRVTKDEARRLAEAAQHDETRAELARRFGA